MYKTINLNIDVLFQKVIINVSLSHKSGIENTLHSEMLKTMARIPVFFSPGLKLG